MLSSFVILFDWSNWGIGAPQTRTRETHILRIPRSFANPFSYPQHPATKYFLFVQQLPGNRYPKKLKGNSGPLHSGM